MAKATDPAGAPSVADLARADEFVVLLVPQKPYEILAQYAESKKISVSEVVAKAFAEYVQRNK